MRVIQLSVLVLLATMELSKGAEVPPVPQYAAEVPSSIKTPDSVQTRIGTLKFFDGLPDTQTVQRVYDSPWRAD
jgi:hypothetical protein